MGLSTVQKFWRSIFFLAFLIVATKCQGGGNIRQLSSWNVNSFLKKFGYVHSMYPSQAQRREAIRNFQRMYNLPATGAVNEATNRMMQEPRCGCEDMVSGLRVGSNIIRTRRWRKSSLTYNFKRTNADLGQTATYRILGEAFSYWAEVTNLSFRRISNAATADIEIIFASRAHSTISRIRGDRAFDGPNGVLAHAYYPNGDNNRVSGDAHFDEDENFTEETTRGINLLQVAVHEIGHSLGLGHSNVRGSIMAASYQRSRPNARLHSSDIASIQALYGANTGVTRRPTIRPPPSRPPPSRPSPSPATRSTPVPAPGPGGNNCQRRIDAVAYAWGRLFVFSGSDLMRISNRRIVSGYPRRLTSLHSSLDRVDAALAVSGRVPTMLLFRGTQAYILRVYTDRNIRVTPTRRLSSLLPIDGAFYSSGVPTFLKGNQYFRMNRFLTQTVGRGRLNSRFGSRVDSAVSVGSSTYFFKDRQYTRYFRSQTTSGSSGRLLFGCR